MIFRTKQEREQTLDVEFMSIIQQPTFSRLKSFLLTSSIADIDSHIAKLEKSKCVVPLEPKGKILDEENVNKLLLYVGRLNYNKAIDDFISYLLECKQKLQ